MKQSSINVIKEFFEEVTKTDAKFSVPVYTMSGLPLIYPKRMGVQFVESKLLATHLKPRTLKEYCENEASYLSGFEKWLESKVIFQVNIFTTMQKKYLRKRILEANYNIDGVIHVGPITYQRVKEIL